MKVFKFVDVVILSLWKFYLVFKWLPTTEGCAELGIGLCAVPDQDDYYINFSLFVIGISIGYCENIDRLEEMM